MFLISGTSPVPKTWKRAPAAMNIRYSLPSGSIAPRAPSVFNSGPAKTKNRTESNAPQSASRISVALK